jgi:hypothetical protein
MQTAVTLTIATMRAAPKTRQSFRETHDIDESAVQCAPNLEAEKVGVEVSALIPCPICGQRIMRYVPYTIFTDLRHGTWESFREFAVCPNDRAAVEF